MRLQGLRGIEQAVENGMKKENLKIEYGDFAVMKVINEIRRKIGVK